MLKAGDLVKATTIASIPKPWYSIGIVLDPHAVLDPVRWKTSARPGIRLFTQEECRFFAYSTNTFKVLQKRPEQK